MPLAKPRPVEAGAPLDGVALARYVADIAGVMLGAGQRELQASVAAIRSRVTLIDWCEHCAEAIAQQSGRERADLFWAQVRAALPLAAR